MSIMLQDHEPFCRKKRARGTGAERSRPSVFLVTERKIPRKILLGEGMQKQSKESSALEGGLFSSTGNLIHGIIIPRLSSIAGHDGI